MDPFPLDAFFVDGGYDRNRFLLLCRLRGLCGRGERDGDGVGLDRKNNLLGLRRSNVMMRDDHLLYQLIVEVQGGPTSMISMKLGVAVGWEERP